MPPKTIVVIDSEAKSIQDRILGAIAVGNFIVIWLSSIASPFFLIVALRNRQYTVAGTILGITAAAYAPWEHGPFSRFLKHWLSENHAKYYHSCRVEFEESLPDARITTVQTKDRTPTEPPPKPAFYAVHPHGAFCIGWGNLFTLPIMDHVRFCFAPALYYSPFFRLFSRCCGRPGSADKSHMIRYMKAQEDLALPPGGFEEATLTSTHYDRVYVKKRTGFIRLCLQHGYNVRPVYVFGEKDLFWNLQGWWDFRLALNRYNFPGIIVWGETLLPVLPRHAVDVRVVVGKTLHLPKITEPTKEEVELWHGKYIAALTALFEEHKEDAYGAEVAKLAKLEIW